MFQIGQFPGASFRLELEHAAVGCIAVRFGV
jgi:hypothetical protein